MDIEKRGDDADVSMAETVSQYPTEWHRDQAALDWLDELLDQKYQYGLKTAELLRHTRARELVELWRCQTGSIPKVDD